MRRRRTAAAASAMILAGSVCQLAISLAPAHANDSAAAIAAGGLELVKNDRVRMVSEILRIAPRLIEVDYIFENTGSIDVNTEVAFPLPDLDQTRVNVSPVQIPFEKDTNFIGFQLWIDGKEVKPNVEVRAFAKGREITAELKRLGVDAVHADINRLGVVSPEAIETLLRLDAIYWGDVIASKDLVVSKEGFATWMTKVSFH
jgi:hypothetical protein